MKQPSASNVESFVMCGASHLLPQSDSHSDRSDHGTAGHEAFARVINGEPGAASKVAELFPGLGMQLAEVLHGVELPTSETAYVVDIKKRTSRFVGRNVGRRYGPLGEYEIGTTLDVEGVKGCQPWLRDWKFGIYSSWWQLNIQAMALLWRPGQAGATHVDAGFVFVDSLDKTSTRLDDRDRRLIYLSDLDERADEVEAAFVVAKRMQHELDEGLPYHQLKTTEGKWCQYCAGYPSCPSKWKLAKAMLGMDVVGNVEALTIEQCGSAWMKLREIKKNIIEKMEDSLKGRMAAEGGLPLPNGKVIRLTLNHGRMTLDKDKAVALLQSKGASSEEIESLMTKNKDFWMAREMNK